MSGLDEQRAKIFAAMATYTAVPIVFAALIKSRMKANVFDPFLGTLETRDVTDDGSCGKGDDIAYTAKARQG